MSFILRYLYCQLNFETLYSIHVLQNYADYECEINECIVFIISQQKVDTLTYGNKNQQMNIHILILLLFQHFAPRAIHKNNTKKKETKLLYFLVKTSLMSFNHVCFLSWTLNVLIFTEFPLYPFKKFPDCSGINDFFPGIKNTNNPH